MKLNMYFNATLIASGSCFIYRHKGSAYVVTARHNILGTHPETGDNLSTTAAIPNRLELVAAEVQESKDKVSRIGWVRHSIDLYEDDENLKPIWLEHSSTPNIDLAVIPFNTDLPWHRAVNDELQQYHDFRPLAGDDAYVVGFPEGFTGGGCLPIWKRATIASEPSVSLQKGTPILLDTATRNGMSGSPVFAKSTGLIIGESIEDEVEEGKLHPQTVIGEAYRFLGVYTSRPLADSRGTLAQLGSVVLPKYIDEILNKKKLGKSPF